MLNAAQPSENERKNSLLNYESPALPLSYRPDYEGRFDYARAFEGRKEVWKSLKTSHFSVAQARLGQFLKELQKK
jgi:hypothetical protein